MNKCDRSENQLFDSMILVYKKWGSLSKSPHLAVKVAIIPQKWKNLCCFKMLLTRNV